MAAPALRSKPPTAQWTPGNRLGAGLTFACIFTTNGSTHRNIAARGVSDVTLVGGTMIGGAYGPTVQLGTGTYAKAPRSSATQPTGGYTVAALVRSSGTPAGALPIMACASVAPVDAVWYLGVSGGLPRFARRGVAVGYQTAAAGSYTWGSDYHLFAGTVLPSNPTDTAGSLRVPCGYCGVWAGTYTAAQYAYTADPLLIGSLYDSTTNAATSWPGDIAAVYIWRRPLTDAEHAALAADPFLPVRTRPRAYFYVSQFSLGATLAAAAQPATAALAGAVAVPGTLGAAAAAATTSLGAAIAVPATLGAVAGAAVASLDATVTITATATMTADAASTSLAGGIVMRFLNWDAVAEPDATNPFQIDPDATTDNTI